MEGVYCVDDQHEDAIWSLEDALMRVCNRKSGIEVADEGLRNAALKKTFVSGCDEQGNNGTLRDMFECVDEGSNSIRLRLKGTTDFPKKIKGTSGFVMLDGVPTVVKFTSGPKKSNDWKVDAYYVEERSDCGGLSPVFDDIMFASNEDILEEDADEAPECLPSSSASAFQHERQQRRHPKISSRRFLDFIDGMRTPHLSGEELLNDCLSQLAINVLRRLRYRKASQKGTAIKKYAGIHYNRFIVLHFLVSLLDDCGWVQTSGDLSRFYTTARPSDNHAIAADGTSNVLVFKAADVGVVQSLFDSDFMVTPYNYLRKVFYFPGTGVEYNPWKMKVGQLRIIADAVLGLEKSRIPVEGVDDATQWSRHRNRIQLSVLLDQAWVDVHNPNCSADHVKAFTHVVVSEEKPWEFRIRAAGQGNAVVSMEFYITGLGRPSTGAPFMSIDSNPFFQV